MKCPYVRIQNSFLCLKLYSRKTNEERENETHKRQTEPEPEPEQEQESSFVFRP